jgi:hypothetical protein
LYRTELQGREYYQSSTSYSLLTITKGHSCDDGYCEQLEGRDWLRSLRVITRVGSAVDHVDVGDHAISVSKCCFATRIVVHGQRVARIPEDLSFEDAATMPAVYSTVVHSVINVGQLAKGQVRENRHNPMVAGSKS